MKCPNHEEPTATHHRLSDFDRIYQIVVVNKRGTCRSTYPYIRFHAAHCTISLFSPMLRHTPDDNLPTQTSREQRKTEKIISECLPSPETASTPSYVLDRNGHLNFIARALFQGFPKQYMYQDASQPWFMFWLLQSFSLLGADIGADNKQRCITSSHLQGRVQPSCLELLILFLPLNIKTAGLVAVLTRQLIFYRLMRASVLWRLLEGQGPEADGIKLIGVYIITICCYQMCMADIQ